jgi:hypothetical protein
MIIKPILASIATMMAIAGNIPYLIDVIKKKIQPHPYTWFVWSIVSMVTFFGQLAKGAGIGAIPTGVAEFFTVIIFFVSLRYGFKNIKRIDTYFLIIALFGIIPWIITKDPTISVIIVVMIDLIAFIPTLRKTWIQPKTESFWLYFMNVTRHALTLGALQAYNIATMLHSIVMIIINTIMSIFIWRGSRKNNTILIK